MATFSVEQTPILVVAALDRELAALRKRDLRSVALLETGEGVARAERRLEDRLSEGCVRAVLSIGFAGALTGSLEAGELVIAREVRGALTSPDEALLGVAERVSVGDSPPRMCVAVTSDEILWQAESKRALASTLSPTELGFVDMESTAIARVCGRRGLPFLIVRSITDLLDEDLPLNFNLCRDAEGRLDAKKVLRAAMLRPRAFAGLLELRRRSEFCSARMARFVNSFIGLMTKPS